MSPGANLEALYRRLPPWSQNFFVSLQGWQVQRRRYGPRYRQVEKEVERSRSLSGRELENFRGRRLTDHLQAAAATFYWRRAFARHRVNLKGTDPFAEVAKLPILSKAEVQANRNELLSSVIPRARLRPVHTSGTTGAGLVFWETAEAEMERWAVWWRFRRTLGLSPRTWCGYFGGRSVVPSRQKSPPYWRYNRPARQIMFSSYHLSERSAPDYWRELGQSRTPWLHGYPSFLALLAGYGLALGLPKLDQVRWVTTGAENLLAGQRQLMTEAFGVRPRQHYGMSEAVANLSDTVGGDLIIDEDFSQVEFIPIAGMTDCYRLIGSNWSNPAFPLLRYDTGDVVTGLRKGGHGGEWRRVASIDGRREDYVVLPDGARVGRLDHAFKDLVHISEAQILQSRTDRVVVRVVKGAGYDQARQEDRLLAELRSRLGPNIRLDIEYCTGLPRTSAGKLRFVVSELPEGQLLGRASLGASS